MGSLVASRVASGKRTAATTPWQFAQEKAGFLSGAPPVALLGGKSRVAPYKDDQPVTAQPRLAGGAYSKGGKVLEAHSVLQSYTIHRALPV